MAARRSLGSLIAKSKENGGFSVQTYSYLYSTLIMNIAVVYGVMKNTVL